MHSDILIAAYVDPVTAGWDFQVVTNNNANPTSSNFEFFRNVDVSQDYLVCLLAALAELAGEDAVESLCRSDPLLRSCATGDAPLISMNTVLNTCLEAQLMVKDRRLDILMGRKLKISSHGLLSNILISALSFGAALESLSGFYGLRAPFFKLTLDEGGSDATVSVDFILKLDASIEEFLIDVVAGSACSIVEFYGHSVMSDTSIYLDSISDDRVSAYRSELKLTPELGNTAFSLTFPKSWLCTVSPMANAELFNMAVMSCYNIAGQAREGSSFSQEVVELILKNPALPWTQVELAEKFHISPSTFRRRLAHEGTSYRKVVLDTKIKVAKQLLVDSKMQVTSISQLLGYADSSNFATAFKRSTGMSPREYRSFNSRV